jgi:hypothetical protein
MAESKVENDQKILEGKITTYYQYFWIPNRIGRYPTALQINNFIHSGLNSVKKLVEKGYTLESAFRNWDSKMNE